MKNFWPHRPKAEGFAIQNFARKYRLKISSISSDKNSNQFLDDKNLMSTKEKVTKISTTYLSKKRIHWANRDFSEYKEAA